MDGPRTSRSNTNPAGPLNWGHPSSRRPRDRKFPAERGRRYRRKLAASRTRHLSSSNREAPPRSPTRHLVLTTQQAAPQRHSPTQLGATPMPMPPQPRRPAGSPLGPRRERSSAREPAPRNSTGAAGFPLPHEPPCPAHAQSRSHPSDEAILRKRRLRDNRRESSLVSIGKQHRSCPRMQKSAGGLCQPRCLRCAVADSPSAARCRCPARAGRRPPTRQNSLLDLGSRSCGKRSAIVGSRRAAPLAWRCQPAYAGSPAVVGSQLLSTTTSDREHPHRTTVTAKVLRRLGGDVRPDR